MTGPRDLGASGLRVSPMVLGGNVFGWTIQDEAISHRVLDRFVDQGGTMIDTADAYSAWVPGHKGGESESVIGRWLKASGKRNQVQIATKVGMMDAPAPLARAKILAAADGSLARLGVETIDLYYAHQDDPDTPQEEVLAAFDTLIKAGKVRTIGASNFHAGRLKSALDVATRESLPHYRVLQPLYNLISRHSFEGELQDLCVTHNIGVLPFYGLAAGFLTGKYRNAEDLKKGIRGERLTPMLTERNLEVLAVMDKVAAETGATLPQISLAWIAAQPGISAPIASATSVEQLDELLGFREISLTADQLDRLAAAGA